MDAAPPRTRQSGLRVPSALRVQPVLPSMTDRIKGRHENTKPRKDQPQRHRDTEKTRITGMQRFVSAPERFGGAPPSGAPRPDLGGGGKPRFSRPRLPIPPSRPRGRPPLPAP